VFLAASIHNLPARSSHHERAIDEVSIVLLSCSVQLHQEEILHLIIRVDEHDILASCPTRSGEPGTQHSLIGLVPDETHARIISRQGPHDSRHIPRRAIVHDDHLEIAEGLAKNRLQAGAQILFRLEHWNHDRHRWRIHRASRYRLTDLAVGHLVLDQVADIGSKRQHEHDERKPD
jgi:hypothetical protein